MASILDTINIAIAAEIAAGGLGATPTDQEVLDRLNASASFELEFVSGSDIYNAIDRSGTEWSGLSADVQQDVRDIYLLGDAIPTKTGTNVRAVLLAAFPGGSNTRAALQALIAQTVVVGDHYGVPVKYRTLAAVNKARAI